MILVTSKEEKERESEWCCGVNMFHSNFKVEGENRVWKKIRFRLIFCSHAALRLWCLLLFLNFFIVFFLSFFPMLSLSIIGLVICSVNNNSLNCASGLIICFCLFVHAHATELRAWRHFSMLVETVFLQLKEFEFYWGAVFFSRCVHSFFNDFDLSKRDKQVNPSWH